MKEHELKTWLTGFKAIAAGLKCYELREDDRGFEVGDTLKLREFEPNDGYYAGGRYTDRWIIAKVVYITRAHGEFKGLEDGYVVMGIKPKRTLFGSIVRY